MLTNSRTLHLLKAPAFVALLAAGGLVAQDVGDALDCSHTCHQVAQVGYFVDIDNPSVTEEQAAANAWDEYTECVEDIC